MIKMKTLLKKIKNCKVCEANLELGANPVVYAHPKAKIVIIGQAPGTKVHNTGIPWNDASGEKLRQWLNLSKEEFYNKEKIAIVPMAFCYPGKGKTGDLPPRKECAPLWHDKLFSEMPEMKLYLLVGQYAQKYYLQKSAKRNLTETVKAYNEYLPKFIPLPHPSPLNRGWLKNNPWFEEDVLPEVRQIIDEFGL